MPRPGDVDTSYPMKLIEIGITLLEPFVGAKTHHNMRCIACSYEWTATPLSKLQNYKRWGKGGCPNCTKIEHDAVNQLTRQANIQLLLARGLEILSDWDGRNSVGRSCHPLPVTVRNSQCGHTFTSNAVNLLRRGVECPTCATQYKTNILNASSERRSDEWKKTASEWKIYKSKVSSLSRYAYKQNKPTINPLNLPQGKAGIEGAYHIDHIVPMRYCYDNNIPEEACAHYTNLQMLGWRENVGSRDKLKPHQLVPLALKSYILL